MRRVIAQARKELTQIRRDRLALVLALVLPLVLLAIFGQALSLEVTNLPIVVQDLDRTPLSRAYIDAYRASLTFDIVPLEVAESPIEALDAGTARAAVIIPEHFDRDLRRGRRVEVQVLVDATDANTANLMRGNATAISAAFLDTLGPEGGRRPAVAARTRLWYNPGRETDKFMGPGVFAVILALFPPLLAALSLSREGEQKTILQVYVSSITAHEYLFGKVLAFLAIAGVQWALALVVSWALYDIWFVGDPTPLLVGTVLYLFCSVAFGVMVGANIPNQAAAIQAIQFGAFLFSFLLSGFLFPISNIPAAIRWVTAIVPARYYIELARDAFVRGGGWPAVWHAPIVLAVLGALFFLVAWRRMRRMQVDA
jgi:ABC-2 type transport system permease protein